MNNQFFKLGIIGNPLSHSISPAMQQAALSNCNLSGSYEKFEVTAENLPDTIKFFKNNDFQGFNVTIPHKIEVIKYLDEIDENAKKIGAVNTVKIEKDGKLIGYNTDIYGFYTSLNGCACPNAAILGCGGAAQAVVFALEKAGCKNLTVYARNPEKANDFVNSLKNRTDLNFEVKTLENANDFSDTDILINATPLGTKGANESKMAITADALKSAKKSILVYDLVYNPAKTMFLKSAKNCGLKTINGLDMLILQGAKSFEIWTEFKPDTVAMKTAAAKELKTDV